MRGINFVRERETSQTISEGPQVFAKWETMFECTDNQEVGLEAAILERVRNSSLVKCSGAENSTGLKPASEAVSSLCER